MITTYYMFTYIAKIHWSYHKHITLSRPLFAVFVNKFCNGPSDDKMKPFRPCGFIIFHLLFPKHTALSTVTVSEYIFPDTMFMILDWWSLVFSGSICKYRISSEFSFSPLHVHLSLLGFPPCGLSPCVTHMYHPFQKNL